MSMQQSVDDLQSNSNDDNHPQVDTSLCLEPELIRFGTEEATAVFMMEKSQRQQPVLKPRSNRPSLTESMNSIFQNLPSFMNADPPNNHTNNLNSNNNTNNNNGNNINASVSTSNNLRGSANQSKQQQQQQQLRLIIDQHWFLNSGRQTESFSEMISNMQSKGADSPVGGGGSMEANSNLANLSIFTDSAKIKSMLNNQEIKRTQQAQDEGGVGIGISGMKKRTNLDKIDLDVIDELSSIWNHDNPDSFVPKANEGEAVKKNGLLDFFSSAPLAIASQFLSKQKGFSQKIRLWNIWKKRDDPQLEKSSVTNEEDIDTDGVTALAESSKTLSVADEQKQQHLSRITSASSDLTVIPQLKNEDEEKDTISSELIICKQPYLDPPKHDPDIEQQYHQQKHNNQNRSTPQVDERNSRAEKCQTQKEVVEAQMEQEDQLKNSEQPLRKKRSLSVQQPDSKQKNAQDSPSKATNRSYIIEPQSQSNQKIERRFRVSQNINLKLNLENLNTAKINLDRSRVIKTLRLNRNSQSPIDQNPVKKYDDSKPNRQEERVSLLEPISALEVYPVVKKVQRVFKEKQIIAGSTPLSHSPFLSARQTSNPSRQPSNQKPPPLQIKFISVRQKQIPSKIGLQYLVKEAISIETNNKIQQQKQQQQQPQLQLQQLNYSKSPMQGRPFKNIQSRNPQSYQQQAGTNSQNLDSYLSSSFINIVQQHQLKQQQSLSKRQDSFETNIFTQRSSNSTHLNDSLSFKDCFSNSVGRSSNDGSIGSGVFSSKLSQFLDSNYLMTRRTKQLNISKGLTPLSSRAQDQQQRQHSHIQQHSGVDTLKSARKAKAELAMLPPSHSPNQYSPTASSRLNSIAVITQISSKLKNIKPTLRGVQQSSLHDSLDSSLYSIDPFQVRKAHLFDRQLTNN